MVVQGDGQSFDISRDRTRIRFRQDDLRDVRREVPREGMHALCSLEIRALPGTMEDLTTSILRRVEPLCGKEPVRCRGSRSRSCWVRW
jgi:hypothetical protein